MESDVSPSGPNFINHTGGTPYAARFAVMGFQIETLDTAPGSTGDGSMFAEECALWFCVQARQFPVVGGQRMVSNIAAWTKANYTPSASRNYQLPIAFTNIPASFNIPDETIFTADQRSIGRLHAFIENLISGNLTYSDDNIENPRSILEVMD
jgi:hypothetical protein